MERQFKGVWIPAEIWLDARLTLVEKALYAEIDSFAGNGKTFHKTNETIQGEYGISRPTVSKSLKKLESLGFIEVTFDGRLRHLTVQADRKIFTGRGKDSFGQQEKNFPAEGKNSTSTNTRERTKENTSKKGVVLPWDSERFCEAWKTWIQERKERGTKKYTPRGEQAALHKLQTDSQGDEATAIQMIHQSIANGWQGLFPLKNQNNATKRPGPSDGSLIAEHLRRLAAQSGESMA
jgi:DNA-binding transcriptional ArsR family regulator